MFKLQFVIVLALGCLGYPVNAWDRPLEHGECTRQMNLWVTPQRCFDGWAQRVRMHEEKVFSTKRPVPARYWTAEAKLWTARSCIGEAGFGAIEECLAIAWVYATRARGGRQSLVSIVRKYSAAVREHEAHRRPWIRQLTLDGEIPRDWPQLNWGYHERLWRKTLVELEQWARGKRPNPVIGANHYGSAADAKRARYVKRWKRVEAPKYFKNWFFDSTVVDKRFKGEIDFGPSYKSSREFSRKFSKDANGELRSYGRLRREKL